MSLLVFGKDYMGGPTFPSHLTIRFICLFGYSVLGGFNVLGMVDNGATLDIFHVPLYLVLLESK